MRCHIHGYDTLQSPGQETVRLSPKLSHTFTPLQSVINTASAAERGGKKRASKRETLTTWQAAKFIGPLQLPLSLHFERQLDHRCASHCVRKGEWRMSGTVHHFCFGICCIARYTGEVLHCIYENDKWHLSFLNLFRCLEISRLLLQPLAIFSSILMRF